MQEARLVKTEQGLKPETEGWFVLNAHESCWYGNEKFGVSVDWEGAARFAQVGVNLQILQPGQPNCYYHHENQQEDFLVLAGECLALVEGQERKLKAWDFLHCPPGTAHVFVGAGEGPCLILMLGARASGSTVTYPADALAQRWSAGVEQETSAPKEAYSKTPRWEALPSLPPALARLMPKTHADQG